MKNCMCHGPRLRSPKGCKSNMERYRKTPNGNDEPINFDINCAKPLGCGSLGYHFSKRFHYPWVYYSRDLGADDHRPNSSLWIQKLLYGWIMVDPFRPPALLLLSVRLLNHLRMLTKKTNELVMLFSRCSS